jgi:hypothetical protein
MAGRSQRGIRYREGADVLGRTAYALGEPSLKTTAQQQAAALSRGVAAPPACTALPAITGTKTVGQTLTCSAGTWASATGDTVARTYQWYRNGLSIAGATANTRVLAAADTGHLMRCRVTGTDENGAAFVFTAQTTAIAAA